MERPVTRTAGLLGLFIALGCICSAWSVASQEEIPELPKNGSEVRVADPEEEKEDFVLLCSGLEAYGHELVTIGLRRSDMNGAVPCVPGDFDGNGYFDFAIWGRLRPDEPDSPGTRFFKILYFAEGNIIKSQQIETPGCDHLWLYLSKEEESEDGEPPTSPHDGLLQIGEGETVYYYIYDDERGILKRIEWPDPNDVGSEIEPQ